MWRWLNAAAGKAQSSSKKRRRDCQHTKLYTSRRRRPAPTTLLQRRLQRAESTRANEPQNTMVREVAADMASTSVANGAEVEDIDRYYVDWIEHLGRQVQQPVRHLPALQTRGPPTMRTLNTVEPDNLTQWQRELRTFMERARQYREQHNPNYQINLQAWVEPEIWFMISENYLLTEHRTMPGTASNDQAVENFLLQRKEYALTHPTRMTVRKSQRARHIPRPVENGGNVHEAAELAQPQIQHDENTTETTNSTSTESEDERTTETDENTSDTEPMSLADVSTSMDEEPNSYEGTSDTSLVTVETGTSETNTTDSDDIFYV